MKLYESKLMLAILFSQESHIFPLMGNVPLPGLQERVNGIGIRTEWVGSDYKHPDKAFIGA